MVTETKLSVFVLTASGFDILFRTRPRALWQQTPLKPVLIPQELFCNIYLDDISVLFL